MSHVLAVAFLALMAWSSIGCESLRQPTAAEVAALNEIQPMRRRMGAVEQQVEGKAERERVDQLADVAQRADQGALKAGSMAEGAERRAAQLEAAGRRTESELRRTESELRDEIGAVKKTLQSQTAVLSALEERLGVVEQTSRDVRERARAVPPSGPTSADWRKAQDKFRAEMVVMQVKMEVAALAGLGVGQVEHVELAGFLSGSADISPVMEADARTRAQIEALKRLVVEGRAEVIQIVSFEDRVPCRRAERDCSTIALRRGLNTASYLGAPKGAVDARSPTDRWGPPAENRRVVVFYVTKGGARVAPAQGSARTPAQGSIRPLPPTAPSAPPAATSTTARPR
jgi:hypothetical protein